MYTCCKSYRERFKAICPHKYNVENLSKFVRPTLHEIIKLGFV